MILEGIVTTVDESGGLNVSPMGPRVDAGMHRLVLRPYQTSRTYANLKRHGEGVFHVTDDVLLLARAAVGRVEPPARRARKVAGWYLEGACRFYEFEVERLDDREERTTIEARVVHAERLRDFFGFNRARHAVVEAAILATRTAFLPLPEILRQLDQLAVLVEKTGGEAEHEAFAFLRAFVETSGRREPEAGT
jgi:hypothetical protein